MGNSLGTPKPKWLLWAGLASLLWNLFGVAAFIMQATMSAEALSSLPAEQQELWGDMGIATWIAYAVAVGAGTLGAIGIILGRKWAVLLFLISLAAIAAQFSYPLVYALGNDMLSLMIFPAFVFIIAITQWFFARKWRAAGWLV
jgi:hypothetical protein